MKATITLIAVGIAISLATAQTKIKASEIIQQLNEGNDMSYSNVVIEGNLDLTDLKNRGREHSSSSWLSNFYDDNDTYVSTVEGSLTFNNCTFTGDVLAYYHLERTEETFIANFEKNVVFRNCNFKYAAEFKYSEFDGIVDFSGSTFNQVANFKYAEFSTGPSFAGVKFEDGADFKYTEFPRQTSFQKATFYGLANFKYSKFRAPLNMENVSFKGSEEFKYTRIDGRSFTSYLLENQ